MCISSLLLLFIHTVGETFCAAAYGWWKQVTL